jgi:hypothetical protein
LTEFTDSTSPATNCGGTLTASSTCTITVTFTPGALGTRTGAITVTSSQGTFVVTLTGTGGTFTQAQPSEIYTQPLPAAGHASISATTMVTPAVNTTYHFSSYLTETVVGSGGTCSAAGEATMQVSVIFQDPNAASAQTVNLGLYTVGSGPGTLGMVPYTSGPTGLTFVAAAGTAVQYSTTYSNGNCTTQPTMQFYPVLEAF